LTPYINRDTGRGRRPSVQGYCLQQTSAPAAISKLCYHGSWTKFTAMMKRSKAKYCRNFVFCSLPCEYFRDSQLCTVHDPRFCSCCKNLDHKQSARLIDTIVASFVSVLSPRASKIFATDLSGRYGPTEYFIELQISRLITLLSGWRTVTKCVHAIPLNLG